MSSSRRLLAPLLAFCTCASLTAQVPLVSIRGPGGKGFAARGAGLGDVDGDGFKDFALGIPPANGGDGAVEIRSGRDGQLIRTLHGDAQEKSAFGLTIAGLGDVDHDGVSDIGVGAPNYSKLSFQAGVVQVFSGRTGKELYRKHGDGPGDLMGTSVSTAGDVDLDGYDDFLAGAPENGDPVLNYGTGYARLWSGKDGSVLFDFRGTAVTDEFGASCSSVGDWNEDGYPDVSVGSLLEVHNDTAIGSTRIFSGKTGKQLHVLWSEPHSDHFGMRTVRVGDLDRDGHDDLVVTCINLFITTKPPAVFFYSGRTMTLIRVIRGDSNNVMLGARVARAGDYDHDGHADVMVIDPLDNTGGMTTGRLFVYSGRTGETLLTLSGPNPGSAFGAGFAWLGDTDGNGSPEFVIGAPGAQHNNAVTGLATMMSLGNIAKLGRGFAFTNLAPDLDGTTPAIGRRHALFLKNAQPGKAGIILASPAPGQPFLLSECRFWLTPAAIVPLTSFISDGGGRWAGLFSVPADRTLIGGVLSTQAIIGPSRSSLGFDTSNGLYSRIGK